MCKHVLNHMQNHWKALVLEYATAQDGLSPSYHKIVISSNKHAHVATSYWLGVPCHPDITHPGIWNANKFLQI